MQMFFVKSSMKIPQGYPETVNQRTDNTVNKKEKGQNDYNM